MACPPLPAPIIAILLSFILFPFGDSIFIQVNTLCRNSYSIEELKELACWITLKEQILKNTGTNYTTILYTRSATFSL
jgi:hypothetical protein